MEWGTPGWLMIAAIVVVATLGDGAGVAVGRALPRCRAGAGRLLESSLVTTPRTSAAHWLAGARPRTLPAAVAPVLAGTGVAAYADSAVWWKAALALLVSLALQVGVNYANDYSDGIRGTDADRVGPMRLVGSGVGQPRARSRRPRSSPFGVAGVAGLVLAATTAWWLLAVGVACVVAAWFYTGGSRPYGYLGARRGDGLRVLRAGRGDRHDVRPDRVVGARPRCTPASAIGALACAILVVNNLRDIPTDRVAGKRTLAVLLGDERTRYLYLLPGGRRGGRGRRRSRR